MLLLKGSLHEGHCYIILVDGQGNVVDKARYGNWDSVKEFARAHVSDPQDPGATARTVRFNKKQGRCRVIDWIPTRPTGWDLAKDHGNPITFQGFLALGWFEQNWLGAIRNSPFDFSIPPEIMETRIVF